MEKRRILAALVLAVIICAMIGAFVEQVHAASTGMMERKGIGGLFQKDKDAKADPRTPTKFQKYLGFGSLVVMVLVVKYL